MISIPILYEIHKGVNGLEKSLVKIIDDNNTFILDNDDFCSIQELLDDNSSILGDEDEKSIDDQDDFIGDIDDCPTLCTG